MRPGDRGSAFSVALRTSVLFFFFGKKKHILVYYIGARTRSIFVSSPKNTKLFVTLNWRRNHRVHRLMEFGFPDG